MNEYNLIITSNGFGAPEVRIVAFAAASDEEAKQTARTFCTHDQRDVRVESRHFGSTTIAAWVWRNNGPEIVEPWRLETKP